MRTRTFKNDFSSNTPRRAMTEDEIAALFNRLELLDSHLRKITDLMALKPMPNTYV